MYYSNYFEEETKTEYSKRKNRNSRRNYRTLTEDIIRTCKEFGTRDEETLKVKCSNCPMKLDKDDNICLVGEIMSYLREDDELVNIEDYEDEKETTLLKEINRHIKRTEFLILSENDEGELLKLNENLRIYKSVRTLLESEV